MAGRKAQTRAYTQRLKNAIHEASHAVMAHHKSVPFELVTVHKKDLKKRTAEIRKERKACGYQCGGRIIFGDTSPNRFNSCHGMFTIRHTGEEITRCMAIAKAMVFMAGAAGLAVWSERNLTRFPGVAFLINSGASDDLHHAHFYLKSTCSRNDTVNLLEADHLLRATWFGAVGIMAHWRAQTEQIASRLMECERMSFAEIDAIMNSSNELISYGVK